MPNTLPAALSIGLLADESASTCGPASGIHVGKLVGRDVAPSTLGHAPAVGSWQSRLVQDESFNDLVAVEKPTTRIPLDAAFQTRRWWEGTVQVVRGHEFVAIITDRTDPKLPDEEAVFEIEEVSPPDRPLIAPGAVFYLFVGTELSPARQQRNVAIIKLRRLPVWTASALNRLEARAQQVRGVLGL